MAEDSIKKFNYLKNKLSNLDLLTKLNNIFSIIE